jgi:hypothetical protein
MPKLVDYASRYEFLRRAAFALVLEEGAQAPTRRAVAARLGCGLNTVRRLVDPSVDLAVLAADEVRTRRRAGRWGRLPEDPAEAARILARRLLPEDESRIDEELVWLRLTGAHAGMGRRRESPLALRHDLQVAERGWSDVTRPAPPPESDTGAARWRGTSPSGEPRSTRSSTGSWTCSTCRNERPRRPGSRRSPTA